MMSLVTLTAYLFRTCVIPDKWLQAVETNPDCLEWLKRCLACILRNLSHLNSLCDPLHKEHVAVL